MRHWTFFLALSLFLTGTSLEGTYIAATVNSKAITTQDLNNRIKLAILSSGLPNNKKTRESLRKRLLDTMINEQIQLQLGEEFSIKIDEAILTSAVREIEQQNNMTAGGLKKMMAKEKIPFSMMKKHLESSIIWREYIRERYKNAIQLSDDDVQIAYEKLKSSHAERRFHLAEISFHGKEAISNKAPKVLSQLNQGVNFSTLAQQNSQAPSASRGGDIGWIPESKIDPTALKKLRTLKPGQITGLIKTKNSGRIYLLRDQLAPGQFSKPSTTVAFKQVFVANPKDAFHFEIEDNMKQVATLASQISSCKNVEKIVASKKGVVQNVKGIPLENLPPELQALLKKTKINRATGPVYTGEGAMFFVVCGKKTLNPKEPSKADIRAQLVDKKLQNLAQQELRTRRAGAHIEIR